jgi:hypothetical protein
LEDNVGTVLLKGLRMLNSVSNFVLRCAGETVGSVCNREQVVKLLIALSTVTFLNAGRNSRIFKTFPLVWGLIIQ